MRKKIILLAALSTLGACFCFASPGDILNFCVTDGPVVNMTATANTIYLCGNFFNIGERTGKGTEVDLTTAHSTRQLPMINNVINAVASDGQGGWFVGGSFNQAGQVSKHNLAHIKNDGTLDILWAPNPNGQVNCIDAVGNTVFVGGAFSTIGGGNSNGLAALDKTTGLLFNSNPQIEGSGVYAIEAVGNTLYIGGNFPGINGVTRSNIAALNINDLSLQSWDPEALGGEVYGIDVNGNTVFAAGSFLSIGGQPIGCLAALDRNTDTNNAFTWNPGLSNLGNGVSALSVDVQGNTIFVAGSYQNASLMMTGYIEAFALDSGTLLPWNPSPNGIVNKIKINGANIYAGGYFTSMNGQQRTYIASFDTSAGNMTNFAPDIIAPIGSGNILDFDFYANTIYYGGSIICGDAASRSFVAAVDAVTGSVSNWNPLPDNPVTCLGIQGNNVIAGGKFSNIGGQSRQYLAAIDMISGTVTAWSPALYGNVTALEIYGNTIFAAGNFPQGVVAIDAQSGQTLTWNPGMTPATYNCLKLNGDTLYIGGEFQTSTTNWTRNYLAAVDKNTGNMLAWNPSVNDYINSVDVYGNTVFAAGNFTVAGGQVRNGLAAIDAGSGAVTAWDPGLEANGTTVTVRSVKVFGNMLYIGGGFNTFMGNYLQNFVGFEIDNQSIMPNTPSFQNGVCDSLLPVNTSLYVGGHFTGANNNADSEFVDQVQIEPIPQPTATPGPAPVKKFLMQKNMVDLSRGETAFIRFPDSEAGLKATITIYNRNVKLVKKIETTLSGSSFEWDGKDSSGATVGAGVYVIFIETPDFKEILKVVIIK